MGLMWIFSKVVKPIGLVVDFVQFWLDFEAIRVAKWGPEALQRPPLENPSQRIFCSLETQVRFLEPIFSFLEFLKFYGRTGKKLISGLTVVSGVGAVVTQAGT